MITGTAVALAALSVTTASTRAYGAERHATSAAVTTSYSVNGYLNGVTDVSRTEAWAVGWSGIYGSPKTLLLHWNGQKWSPVTSPAPVAGALFSVTAISPGNVLAAGYQATSSTTVVPVVLHWNGSAWSRVPTPKVDGEFAAVGDAGGTLLAVGGLNTPPMLLMERTGTTWRNLPVPSAPGYLDSLVVTGSKSAWTAGVTVNQKTGVPYGDVLLRWNGSSWKSESFPLHGTNENLWELAAGPGGAVWAVGDSHNTAMTAFTPLSMLWNGSSWRKVAVAAPANTELFGVGFVPGGTAWAVGISDNGKRTVALHWTGTAWKQVASPNTMAGENYLNAVSASSTDDAWAVGSGAATTTGAAKTVILHWNGSAWH